MSSNAALGRTERQRRRNGATLLSCARCLLPLLLLLGRPFWLRAQPDVTNRVLAFDGKRSHVELPSGSFQSLTQATVEGWIQWERLDDDQRFFDFGDKNQEMYVSTRGTSGTLKLLISEGGSVRHRLEVPRLLTARQWNHVAVVTGPGGLRLYFNGWIATSSGYTGSLNSISGRHYYIGRENSRAAPTAFLEGRVDEFRVWAVERSADEIRETMFLRLKLWLVSYIPH